MNRANLLNQLARMNVPAAALSSATTARNRLPAAKPQPGPVSSQAKLMSPEDLPYGDRLMRGEEMPFDIGGPVKPLAKAVRALGGLPKGWKITPVSSREIARYGGKESVGNEKALADHRTKEIFIPDDAKNFDVLVEHEAAHARFGNSDKAAEEGEVILEAAQQAIFEKTPAHLIEDYFGISPETVAHLRKYTTGPFNTASLIEEAFAAENGFQFAKMWKTR